MSNNDGVNDPVQLESVDGLAVQDKQVDAERLPASKAETAVEDSETVVASTSNGSVTVAAEPEEQLGLSDNSKDTLDRSSSTGEREVDGGTSEDGGDATTIIFAEEESNDPMARTPAPETADAITSDGPAESDDPSETAKAGEVDSKTSVNETDTTPTAHIHPEMASSLDDAIPADAEAISTATAPARPTSTKKFTSSLSMNKKFLEKCVLAVQTVQKNS